MTAAPASPLVLTKLRVPAARARLVRRARLVERLTLETGSGLLLVCAPAGYGKTTLFVEWAHYLQKYGFAVAWYALDPGDNDPLPFVSYLVASLMQALGPLPELVEAAHLLRSSAEMEAQRILPMLINAMALCDRECVVILDDYHLISHPAIHSALAFLVEHLPENGHIAIGTRVNPPLPLARLRARGRLVEIRADGLRFTADEAALFLNQVMRLELPPAMVKTLEARTEGWVAGLQLAALAMQAPLSGVGGCGPGGTPGAAAVQEGFITSFSGGHRYLTEYLLEEVFNGLPAEVQAFLLATSILERMCAPLCDAVSSYGTAGSSDRTALLDEAAQNPQDACSSESILARLEQTNLFVVALDDVASFTGDSAGESGDSSVTWYRYHHLFRDFLQARLRKTGSGRVSDLHGAASAWLAAHGLLREAARHAFQIPGWEYAAKFVEQHSFTLIIHGEVSLIYEWCAGFPEEVMQAHPMLCILQSWPLVFRFRRENRARVEARLRQAELAITTLADVERIAELREHAAVVRSFLAMAPDPSVDPRAQLELALAALARYPADDPGRFSTLLTVGYAYMALHDAQSAREMLETARQIALRQGLYYGVVESTFHLAQLVLNQGRLRQAEELCLQGQADIAAMVGAANIAGEMFTEANAIEPGQGGAMLDLPNQGLPALGGLDIALGCVLVEQDRLEEAEQRLLRGLERIGQRMNPYYLLAAYVALFRLREIQGQTEEALAFLARLEAAWPDIDFCTRGLRAAHGLRIAPQSPVALKAAADWLAAFNPPDASPGMGPLGGAEAYSLAGLAWARVQIAIGQAQSALDFIWRQMAAAKAHALYRRVIELSLLEALAAEAEGDLLRAWAALECALDLALPEKIFRIFDQGAAVTHLLQKAAQNRIRADEVAQVLAALGAARQESGPTHAASGPAEPAVLLEPLSERELEVLRLMAQGATNQAIAEQLVITVGTVKSHINHILGKLGARNRTEAVAKARTARII